MDNEKQHDPWCSKCIYYGRNTRTCDYILVEDQRRPCPAGAGCTARRTSKKVSKVGKPRWDTELGRLLWLDGKSDREIAEEMGVATNTVLHQRKTKWEKGTARPEPEEAPPQMEEVPQPIPEEAVVEHQTKQETPAYSMATMDGVYHILEEATKSLNGIEAICTADAILCLWNWSSADDLRRARAAITHLIRRLEG